MKDLKKVAISKKQAEMLNNIFSIKVNDTYVFRSVEGKPVLDQLLKSKVDIDET